MLRHALPLLLSALPALAADEILWNRVGYDAAGARRAVVRNTSGAVLADSFAVFDSAGSELLRGSLGGSEMVSGWGEAAWKVLDFTALSDTGRMRLKLLPDGAASELFTVGSDLLVRETGPAVVGFFRAMRSRDEGDRTIAFYGHSERGTRDVYGGWKDATGDDGKYLSHLSYANFMNPQQIPFVAWSLLRARDLVPGASPGWDDSTAEEAAWGADYLLRVLDTAGYFYINVFRKDWSSANPKLICAWTGDSAKQGVQTDDWQAAWREGGGMATAALALAYRSGVEGDSSPEAYLAGAKRAYAHLAASEGRWADDGRENLIDHVCALLAAVELFRATGEAAYARDAAVRVDSLAAYQTDAGWFRAGAGGRPFWHGVDEGLPLVALWAYLEADPSAAAAATAREVLIRSLAWHRAVTREVANPFLYPRMLAPDTAAPSLASSGDLTSGATVSVSASETGYPAANAVDGNTGTRWSSWSGTSTAAEDTGWIQLDLGGVAVVDSVALDWEAGYATAYRILVSQDGAAWDTAATGGATGSGWEGHALGGIAARFVRMQGVSRATAYGYSLWEFRVFGTLEREPADSVASSTRFFMPHDNETGYWWQGENARLASLSAALFLAGKALDSTWVPGDDSLSREAAAPLDWILGQNTADMNFLYGFPGSGYAGYNNLSNAVGGICNGITAVSDADPAPVFHDDGSSYVYWRWVEQWLPHDAWYLFAAAARARAAVPAAVDTEIVVVRDRAPSARFSIRRVAGGLACAQPGAESIEARSPDGRILARSRGAEAVLGLRSSGLVLVTARGPGWSRTRTAVLP